MSALWLIQLLFVALGIVMAGLGLSLRVSDFRGLLSERRGVLVALILQMIVLPLVAVALVFVFRLPGLLAVGMVLLAATPGSISANLYSHLFGGNVAFNIALTGLNTFLSALTLPLMSGLAIDYFIGTNHLMPILLDKAAQTIGIVVIPVVLGMAVAAKAPRFAARVDKQVKVLSAAVVVTFSVAAIVKEWSALVEGFAQVGAAILVFNAVSVAVGYGVARAVALRRAETITIAFQVSVHNAIQAIYVGLAVLNEPLVALPAAVYSITMNVFALGFGLWLNKSRRGSETAPDDAVPV
jgi:BASS family bile acid:Na+ symporter